MAIHTEYSLRHKVEFRPDEFADDPRTFAHPAIRIIQRMMASAWSAIADIKRSM